MVIKVYCFLTPGIGSGYGNFVCSTIPELKFVALRNTCDIVQQSATRLTVNYLLLTKFCQ
jgi:hypothetical protein